MTLPKPSKVWPLLLLSGGLLTPLFHSCDNGCEQLREHFLHASFISTSGRTLRALSFTAHSEGKQYTQPSNASFADIEIDLNPTSDSIMLCLSLTYSDYGDSFTKPDTLTIRYKSNPKFLDLACDCTFLYEITEVQQYTHNVISHINIDDAHVNDSQAINITFEY